MLVSDDRIAESVIEMLDRLQRRTDIPKDAAFDLSVAAMMLRHSDHISSDGGDLRLFFERASELLQEMKSELGAEERAGRPRAHLSELLERAMVDTQGLQASPLNGAEMKRAFLTWLTRIDDVFGRIALEAPPFAATVFSRLTGPLLEQHNALQLFGRSTDTREHAVSIGDPPTAENLTAYVRQQLSDPTACVTDVNTLIGGFGKETSLFSVAGANFNADLVIRRDSPLDPLEGLDCHTSSKEFPLLLAVFKRGFLVPEPLWQAERSSLIKGPPFTIMRCSPGATVGSAIGGTEKVPVELQRTLARITARLHALPQLTELSDNPALAPQWWNQSAGECARRYIAQWYAHYLNSSHLPVPAMHGLFNWLLSHIPGTDDASGLVHGDIGFHNLLFNQGQLSAVLDWEFAHVGDPAEDLGYIRSFMGAQLDWPAFMDEYGRAGGRSPSAARIDFYEIWAHVRNAVATILFSGHFEAGRLRHIKYGMILYKYLPHYMARAQELIANHGRPGLGGAF